MAYKFINPYNFVPLGGEPKRKEYSDCADEKLYTGCIEYSLLTKTPLFIPNTSNDRTFKISGREIGKDKSVYHRSFDFFSYEKLEKTDEAEYFDDTVFTPVIPGSEVRGLIRSTYEILTNSCLSAIEDDNSTILSKRNCQVFNAGLIERTKDGKYNLFSADDALLRTKGENNLEIDLKGWSSDKGSGSSENKYGRKCYIQSQLKEGEAIKFSPLRRDRGKDLVSAIGPNCLKEGFVIKGEDGPEMKDKYGNTMKNQKHCIHVFSKKSSVITNVNVDTLDKVLQIYSDIGDHKYSEYSEKWKEFKNGKGNTYFPVYYSTVDKERFMFSPASITREVYFNKLSQMLKGHKPCDDKDKLCPACSLFGTLVSGKKAFSVASKIRVSDLYTNSDKDECYDQIVTLKELSSPKIENVEFYLKNPAEGIAQYWTFDYYVTKNGEVKVNCPEINGRKIYWHHPDFKLDDAAVKGEDGDITERNMTIRPVRSGIVFNGKLFFDKISKCELDRLIEILNGCDAAGFDNKKHGFKLGAGKPLGLGSVALNVDKVVLREIVVDNVNKTISMEEAPYHEKESAKFDLTISNIFAKITDFNALSEKYKEGYKVSYPMTKDDGDIFEWFTKNHKAYRKKNGDLVNNNMPNDRLQVYYEKYMKAGTADLVDNAAKPKLSEANKPFNKGGNYSDNYHKKW